MSGGSSSRPVPPDQAPDTARLSESTAHPRRPGPEALAHRQAADDQARSEDASPGDGFAPGAETRLGQARPGASVCPGLWLPETRQVVSWWPGEMVAGEKIQAPDNDNWYQTILSCAKR